tara:strand:+ start:1768 stop:2118 length:351 start_codon:yes stop_codon:yes gene_type:complete
MEKKQLRRIKIKRRIRGIVNGTSEKPRMTVFRSNKEIYVQLIDDKLGNTLVSASSVKLKKTKSSTKSSIASEVGKLIAEKSIKLGINQVMFDRNGYLYHGRVKMLADGARDGGLKF